MCQWFESYSHGNVNHVCYGVFTLPGTDTDTDKKWVIKNCV